MSCTNSKDEIKMHNAIIYDFLDAEKTGVGITITNNNEDVKCFIGKRLQKGDVITTDVNGKIHIRVDDTKNILLESNSSLEIIEFANGNLVLSLIYGQFFFDVT